jgi:hypothetical protein
MQKLRIIAFLERVSNHTCINRSIKLILCISDILVNKKKENRHISTTKHSSFGKYVFSQSDNHITYDTPELASLMMKTFIIDIKQIVYLIDSLFGAQHHNNKLFFLEAPEPLSNKMRLYRSQRQSLINVMNRINTAKGNIRLDDIENNDDYIIISQPSNYQRM